ncbi:MAG: hypothetical protein WD232_03970 [Acidimicrobiales bacterium]
MGDTLGLVEGRFGWRWVLLVAAAALGIAVLVLRVARMAITLPLRYFGDALLHAAYVQRMQEAGWYIDNDRLGAPWGLDASDFPLGGENLHWLALKLIGIVAPTPWAAINAYYLLTYVLVAVAAFIVLRALWVRPPLAAAAALLFSFLPFHQFRGVSHLLRSGYYVVPFLVLVVMWVAQPGRFLNPVTGRAVLLGFRRDRVVLVGLLALVVGASDTQNTAYGVLLVVALSVAGSISSGSFRPTLLALGFAGIAAVSLAANNAPYLYKVLDDGPNDQVAARALWEQEVYALRPAHLLFPIPHHRVDALASFRDGVDVGVTAGELSGQPLGAIGGAAFVATLVAAGVVLVGRRDRMLAPQVQTAAVCGLVSLVAIAVATPGGLAFILSALGLTIYRTWNRISPFIAFASLLGGALLVDLCLTRMAGRRWASLAGRRSVAVLAVLATVVGVLDQTPHHERLAQSDATSTAFRQDQRFYEAVEAWHPARAMVFQLPITRFPEGGDVVDLQDYEQLTAYLHTEDLRWSAGAIRGRPASYWQEHVGALSLRDSVRAVAAAGFAGVVVHQRGLADRGAALGHALEGLAGPPTVEGERDVVHHDLTGVFAALVDRTSAETVAAAGAQLLDPVRVEVPSELYGVEGARSRAFQWASTSEVTYEVVNPSEGERSVSFSGSFSHIDPEATWIRVEGPGIRRTLARGAPPFSWTATVPPGSHELRVTSDGRPQRPEVEDTRTLGLLLGVMVVLDDEARTLLCGAPDPEDRPYCGDRPGDEAAEGPGDEGNGEGR